jgi:hypothetical protein
MDSLKEETTLSEAWFTADAHYAGVRPTIRSGKPNNGAETDFKTGWNEKQ